MAKAAPKKFILLLCMVGVLLAGAALAPSLAWYRPVKADFGPANINGAVRASYFQSGNGKNKGQIVGYYDENETPVFNDGYTKNDYNGTSGNDAAYEIKTPEQFYNLAWLQYLGYFNKYDADGNEIEDNAQIQPTYFYLSADLNMTGYVLPPIGTSVYPFIGSFDGCGHTVSNLTVSNVLDSGDMAVDGQLENAEIVGVFGVVGSLDAPAEPTNEMASVTSGGKSYTYSSITNKVENVTFSNVTVETKTASALVGLAAGYVNGTLKNVGVADSTLDIQENTAALGYTGSLSDYSLVGYCTAPYLGGGETVTTKHFTPEREEAGSGIFQPGAGNSWGGSVDMKSMYERLLGIYRDTALTKSASVQITPSTTSDAYYKNFYDKEHPLRGSICFSNNSEKNESYMYLFGKDNKDYKFGSEVVPTDGTECYISAVDGNGKVGYLVNTPGYPANSSTGSHVWLFELNGNGFTIRRYGNYLMAGNSLTSKFYPSDPSVWTLHDDGKLSSDGKYICFDSTKSDDYAWDITEDAAKATSLIFSTSTEDAEVTVNNKDLLNHTYIPLNVDAAGGASNNTGYIVGGTTYNSSRRGPNEYNQGDVRVSGYNISYIQNATGSAQGYTAGDFEVLTVGSSGYARVQDAYNENSANNALSGYEKKSVDALGLTKYTEAREAMHGLLTGAANIYGLHFMAGDPSRLVTAEEVSINGNTYENYTMPEGCVDFILREAGRINFFAGTYSTIYRNNVLTDVNYFFALHHILRGEGNSIVKQYQIDAVYQENGDFYYRSGDDYYKNDEITATTLPEDAALTFDMTWLTAPGTLTQNAVYYFEIPVGAGEFALGCKNAGTSDDNGAYLLYLDISANGQSVTARSVTKEYIEITTPAYPLGVDFVSAGSVNNGSDASAAVTLPAGGGEVNFSRNGNAITVSSYTGSSAAYIADGVELWQGTDQIKETSASSTSTSAVKLYTLTDTVGTNGSTRTIRIRYDETADSFTYTLDGTELIWKDLSQAVGDLPTMEKLQEEIKGYSNKNAQTVLEYTYSAAIDANVTWGSSFAWNEKKTGGAYAITLSADKALSVTVTKLADSYSATLNGNAVTKDETTTVDASAVQNAARRWPLKLSVKKPSISAYEEPFDNERYPEGGAAKAGYGWSDMTDEELTAWLLDRANRKAIRAVAVLDMDGQALQSLYDRAETIADGTSRQTALDRLNEVFCGPSYLWTNVGDKAFVTWFLSESETERLRTILSDEESEKCQSLLQRIADIEDEAQRLAAEARLEELRKLLAQHPWEKQTDEGFVYWLSDDTNLVTIKNILADEESEAYASLLARVAAIKDEALRAQAEARLALIRGLLPKKYDWDTQTDEDFVYWLRDDTNVSAVRAALDDPLAELSLRERIRAIADAALRALAEARIEEIRASGGIYGTDKDTEIVQPGGGVYEVEDDTEIVQPPSPGGTYGVGSDTEVSPPPSGSGGLYRNGADTQMISAADAAETERIQMTVFLPVRSAPAPVRMAAPPSADSIPRAGKERHSR